MRYILQIDEGIIEQDWRTLKNSWNRLPLDQHMGDGGTYRFRRHAVYRSTIGSSNLALIPMEPHYQSKADNGLNGGTLRYFAPIEQKILENRILIKLLGLCNKIFSEICPYYDWKIEAHQFRVVTSSGKAYPTPEGVHRDGVSFVLMMLIERLNVTHGSTFLHSKSGALVFERLVSEPFETAIINDEWVTHGVSSIAPTEPGHEGHRDMLVITFCKV